MKHKSVWYRGSIVKTFDSTCSGEKYRPGTSLKDLWFRSSIDILF